MGTSVLYPLIRWVAEIMKREAGEKSVQQTEIT